MSYTQHIGLRTIKYLFSTELSGRQTKQPLCYFILIPDLSLGKAFRKFNRFERYLDLPCDWQIYFLLFISIRKYYNLDLYCLVSAAIINQDLK